MLEILNSRKLRVCGVISCEPGFRWHQSCDSSYSYIRLLAGRAQETHATAKRVTRAAHQQSLCDVFHRNFSLTAVWEELDKRDCFVTKLESKLEQSERHFFYFQSDDTWRLNLDRPDFSVYLPF